MKFKKLNEQGQNLISSQKGKEKEIKIFKKMFLYKIFNQNITYHEERLETFWISIHRDIVKYILAYSHDEMYAAIKTSFFKNTEFNANKKVKILWYQCMISLFKYIRYMGREYAKNITNHYFQFRGCGLFLFSSLNFFFMFIPWTCWLLKSETKIAFA